MFEMTDTVKTVSNIFWKVSWLVVTPLLLTALTIFSWIDSGRLETAGYVYPAWTEVVGNLISCLSLLGIFGYMGYAIVKTVFIDKQVRETKFNYHQSNKI